MARTEKKQNATGGTRNAGALLALHLAGFVGDSIVDGPGLRCALFGQGCPHACPGCHNPETQPFAGGEEVSIEEAYRRIKAYPLCKGITFSGGEPFSQAEAFAALACLLRADGYELAAYSGYTFEELQNGAPEQKELLTLLDILIDGRFVLVERNLTLRFRGSENQRILNVPQSLVVTAPVWETSERWVGKDE
jgi:anaerobic ribonucleoside-triphosphate reductase activating protein